MNQTLHLYFAVNCETPGCTAARMVKYLGLASAPSVYESLIPETFESRCAECKRSHHYKRSQVYLVKSEKAPPPEFENLF
jgi:hypothetical protein